MPTGKRRRVRTPEEELDETKNTATERSSPVPMNAKRPRTEGSDTAHTEMPSVKAPKPSEPSKPGSKRPPARSKLEPAIDPRFVDEDESSDEEASKAKSKKDAKARELEEIGVRIVTDGMTDEEVMRRMLGFTEFKSTKGKQVEENMELPARGMAAKTRRRRYRQYMNRHKGFNRRLAPDKIFKKKKEE